MESVLRYLDWKSVDLALLAGLLVLVLMEIFRLNSSRSRNPPGPKPLPFVGNLPQLVKEPMAFIRSVSFLLFCFSNEVVSSPAVGMMKMWFKGHATRCKDGGGGA